MRFSPRCIGELIATANKQSSAPARGAENRVKWTSGASVSRAPNLLGPEALHTVHASEHIGGQLWGGRVCPWEGRDERGQLVSMGTAAAKFGGKYVKGNPSGLH